MSDALTNNQYKPRGNGLFSFFLQQTSMIFVYFLNSKHIITCREINWKCFTQTKDIKTKNIGTFQTLITGSSREKIRFLKHGTIDL